MNISKYLFIVQKRLLLFFLGKYEKLCNTSFSYFILIQVQAKAPRSKIFIFRDNDVNE